VHLVRLAITGGAIEPQVAREQLNSRHPLPRLAEPQRLPCAWPGVSPTSRSRRRRPSRGRRRALEGLLDAAMGKPPRASERAPVPGPTRAAPGCWRSSRRPRLAPAWGAIVLPPRSLADSDRAGADRAPGASTDVLGPVRFELVSRAGGRAAGLRASARRAQRRRGLRAVIAARRPVRARNVDSRPTASRPR
jgi:hypothetical protein